MNKIDKTIFHIILRIRRATRQRMHAGLGGFLIFSCYAVNKLFPIFDENIFLFCEEIDLANRAEKAGILMFYEGKIKVYHKEDGSMRLSNINQTNELGKAYVYCFEKWYRSDSKKCNRKPPGTRKETI
jgi:GT2 family glycosyltransferase